MKETICVLLPGDTQDGVTEVREDDVAVSMAVSDTETESHEKFELIDIQIIFEINLLKLVGYYFFVKV